MAGTRLPRQDGFAATGIDWEHPYARNLVSAVVPGVAQDLVTGYSYPPQPIALTERGPVYNGSSDGSLNPGRGGGLENYVPVDSSITVYVRVYLAAVNNVYMGLLADTLAAGSNFSLQFYVANNNLLRASVQLVGGNQNAIGASAIGTGWYDLIMLYDYATQKITFSVNLVRDASATVLAGGPNRLVVAGTGLRWMRFGVESSAVEYWREYFQFGLLWARDALEDAESLVRSSPQRIFAKRRSLYFAPPDPAASTARPVVFIAT